MSRRVAVTGLGAVTGFGVGMDALWEGLVAGRTSLGPITRFDASAFRSKLAGEAKGFSAKDFVPKHYRKAVKVMARDIELAVAAAKGAVEDAGLVTRGVLGEGEEGKTTYAPERLGCQIGAGLIAAETDELAMAMSTAVDEAGRFSFRRWGESGMENLTPLWLLKYLPNMLACHVTIIHGAEGPSNTITCAEASGLLSIGESSRVIERGAADACFSGGAESKLNPMGLIRLDLVGQLAATGDETDGSKLFSPYSSDSKGGILGEGGGILILEELSSAHARGARVYAEIAGFGAGHSDPGYPDEADEGYRAAIENALEDAGIGPERVSAIVPMASGVPAIDRAELSALRAVFGARLAEVPMVSVGPCVGNCAAGTGGIQAAVAAKCVREGRLPARLYGAGRAPEGVRITRSDAAAAELEYVLACSGTLGGQNAAIVFGRAG